MTTASPPLLNDRSLRFSDYLPPARTSLEHLTIVGLGAIGRQLALLLSQLPFASLTLVDFDSVSEVNLGPQGYYPSHINQLKVEATASDCLLRNPSLPIHTLPSRLTSFDDLGLIPYPTFAFLCVDSMAARTSLSASASCPLIDTRMGAQTAHIIYRDPASPSHHASTLFPDNEALQEPCTLRSTPWCASACASLAFSLMAHHLRGNPLSLPPHHILNLTAMELFSPPRENPQ